MSLHEGLQTASGVGNRDTSAPHDRVWQCEFCDAPAVKAYGQDKGLCRECSFRYDVSEVEEETGAQPASGSGGPGVGAAMADAGVHQYSSGSNSTAAPLPEVCSFCNTAPAVLPYGYNMGVCDECNTKYVEEYDPVLDALSEANAAAATNTQAVITPDGNEAMLPQFQWGRDFGLQWKRRVSA